MWLVGGNKYLGISISRSDRSVVFAQCQYVCVPSANISLLLHFETKGVNSQVELETFITQYSLCPANRITGESHMAHTKMAPLAPQVSWGFSPEQPFLEESHGLHSIPPQDSRFLVSSFLEDSELYSWAQPVTLLCSLSAPAAQPSLRPPPLLYTFTGQDIFLASAGKFRNS